VDRNHNKSETAGTRISKNATTQEMMLFKRKGPRDCIPEASSLSFHTAAG